MKNNFIILIILLCISISSNAQGFDSTTVHKEKIITLLNLVENYYVENKDQKKLVETVIRSILKDLDPHSVYIPKKKVEKTNEPLKGNFEGVGIQFNILEDTILVVATIPGGPSEKVGLMAGDKIITIDKEEVAGIEITNKGVADRLRGAKGTVVDVEIKRHGIRKLLDFKITRDKIPLFSIDASYMVNDEVGYIKVNKFASKTPVEFKEALDELKAEGMQKLILDLQGNGGGYLKAAFAMADEFLEANKMIVYTQGVNSPKRELTSSGYGNFESGDLIILVNQSSASASEIVSGAVQDWDRGLILGRRTFGKGLVQRPFTLPDGSQVRLTIADYYTPSGRFIQKSYSDGIEAYRKELNTRYKTGELTDSLKLKFPDSLKFSTNNGRTVYGGGGITPDVNISIDTSDVSDYFWSVIRKGIVNSFTLNYVDKHRKKIEKYYPNIQTFDQKFEIDEDLLNEFVKYAVKKEIEKDEKGLEKSKIPLKVRIKALIARSVFNEEAYYIILNKKLNAPFIEAVKIFDEKEYNKYLK